MHVLYVHKNFPAQFGHVAQWLVRHAGFRCTFVSERDGRGVGGVERLQYNPRGGATEKTHFCSRSFENFTWHSHAVYEALKAHPWVKPDLVVGHSGFGSTAFLPNLYDCPIINFCEWFYSTHKPEHDFRCELPVHPLAPLRSQIRNAMFLTDLDACTAAYSPTWYQRSQLPREYQYKIETLFDGIDTGLWHPQPQLRAQARRIKDHNIPPGVRIVTYVSRGFESLRGFDIFMQVAKQICQRRRDVLFVCVGSDQEAYSSHPQLTRGKSFREYVLAQDDFDLSRFLFTGRVPPAELARILNLSDLHIYLTAPFVLSWSLLNAMACGCTVLASDTAPVQEVINHARNGLLAPFHDVQCLGQLALAVLDDPEAFRPLGQAAVATIDERYSMNVSMPRMLDFYARVVAGKFPSRDSASAPQEAAAATIEPRIGSKRKPLCPIERLRARHLWPAEKPRLPTFTAHGALRDPRQRLPAGLLPPNTQLIVQLGAGAGALTLSIADSAPAAEIIAIDRWVSHKDGRGQIDCKAMTTEVRERFYANCWELRERIIAISAGTAEGLEEVYGLALRPEVMVYSAENSTSLEEDLGLIRQLFPRAVLVGTCWSWPRAQRALAALVRQQQLRLEVSGNFWQLSQGHSGRGASNAGGRTRARSLETMELGCPIQA